MKYFQKLKRQPPPLVQDLRPEVLGMSLYFYFRSPDFWFKIFLIQNIKAAKAREKAEKELARKTLKSTSDILQDQAAAERVARLSRMRPDSSDSEDSSDDEQDQSYLQQIRENIKKEY